MKLTITFCGECNYYPEALRVRDEVEEIGGVKIELVKGRGGIFEVSLNDEVIYTKAVSFRFPGNGEITRLIRGKMETRRGQGHVRT